MSDDLYDDDDDHDYDNNDDDDDDEEKDEIMNAESVSWCQRNFLLF